MRKCKEKNLVKFCQSSSEQKTDLFKMDSFWVRKIEFALFLILNVEISLFPK